MAGLRAGDLSGVLPAVECEPHKKLREAVRALLGGTRDVASEDEALAAFGLVRDGAPADADFDVWPENWRGVVVFSAVMTQWTVGMAGPTGLRYEALPFVLEVHGVAREEWPDLFGQIRVCESEALKFFAERRNG